MPQASHWGMAKKKPVTDQASAGDAASNTSAGQKLTYRQERFIQEYVKNGGNGTQAALLAGYSPDTARMIASENLTKPYILDAIEQWRAEARATAKFTRDDALAILVGMATANLADFADVLRDPRDQDAYVGLGHKIHALKDAHQSYKNGNSISLVDKRAAVNDLWDKLGLGSDVGKGDRLAFLGELLGAVQRKRSEGTGEPG